MFGLIFAVNSSVHSYRILAYTDQDDVTLKVGFYYMANATGRLIGTLLSGIVFQLFGGVGCLWVSARFVLLAGGLSLLLPRGRNSNSSLPIPPNKRTFQACIRQQPASPFRAFFKA